MDFLKELFGEEALTYDQLSTKVTERGFKVADLSTGNYVAKKKYTDDITSRDTQISDLQGQISTRDTDLKALKKQIEDAGNDTQIADLTAQLSKLQGDYKNAKNEYETKLTKQAYEFAVKDFAGTLQFSSKAAKKSFIKDMLDAQLSMKNDTIIGATDFLDAYKAENEDSFVIEGAPEPEPGVPEPKPTFVLPTPPTPPIDDNPFSFNFTGVR